MEIELVDEQVDRNGVVHADFHDVRVGDDFDFFSLDRDFQVLHDFENIVANLLVGIVVHDGKARLFLHFVGKLILGYVSGEDFVGHKCAVNQDGAPNDRLNRAAAALRARGDCGVVPNSGVMYQSFSRRRPRVTVFVTGR
jgi:hypothetical protein